MKSFLLGLSVLLFLGCSKEKTVKVGIQPFNDFNKSLADTVSNTITKVFGIRPYILESKPIPKQAFINIKSPRYRADKLIKLIRDEMPDSLDHVIGLLDKDISITKKDSKGNIKEPKSKYTDFGIFGFGYRPGSSCVISTFRLHNNKNKFIERLKKISVHELGHNLGLKHCESKLCVMRDAAETMKTIDFVKLELCGNCKRKIQ